MKPLPFGAYELLLSREVATRLAATEAAHALVPLDPAEAASRLAHHLAGVIERHLDAVPSHDRLRLQLEITNSLVATLGDGAASDSISRGEVLRAVHPRLLPNEPPPPRPDVPLLDHDLLANAPGEPSFAHVLSTELTSADRIDAVVAFIRWTGLNLVRPALLAARARGVPIRVLTTTYTGSTERAALDWLVGIGAEVRVSYDTRTTRLHAKSWLLHRETGFSTAFIGSSNLSHAALVDGIEWNVRLAEASARDVVKKLRATFDSLWADVGFEAYSPQRDAARFDEAVAREPSAGGSAELSRLEVRPWPYQREMLEALIVDRERFHRTRSLLVAPTGTGKTVVAALDFAALLRGEGGVRFEREPRLLFVAHRHRILSQSRAVFRDVLRRGSFGELLVSGERPREWSAVFASIQSLSTPGAELPSPDRFDVVYVDEFHHAEANTYRRLLDYLQPKVLVGLTATPERADGFDVRERFGGRFAFEMRLWDALDQQLLAPFHYFGVSDGTDLRHLGWERGGYRTRDLETVYDGNDARTSKVLQALADTLADPRRMRALGFCVSVRHAQYMAQRFSAAGLPAAAMSADTEERDREAMLGRLARGELRVVFAVDVLSEGVDLPAVDTILLLRPTESATVFLQQLGRGLRLHPSKSVCTVLDFIGQQHRRFRFDLRLRALTGRTRAEVVRDVHDRFPFLPSGCALRLDRQVEEHILENLKSSITSGRRSIAAELRLLAAKGAPSFAEFLEASVLDLDEVYARCSWTELRRDAGIDLPAPGPREAELLRGVVALREVDDPERIDVLFDIGAGIFRPGADARRDRLAAMLATVLFDDGCAPPSIPEVLLALGQEPAVLSELTELAQLLSDRAAVVTYPSSSLPRIIPLHEHATYRREEVLVALGARSLGAKLNHREGVCWVERDRIDAFFVTLEKSEDHYSPSTRYRDYAIARDLFHWESQSSTSRESPTGRRYADRSSTPLLFVRRNRRIGSFTPGFVYLGPLDFVETRGDRPMAITWRLRRPMPERWFRTAKAVAG